MSTTRRPSTSPVTATSMAVIRKASGSLKAAASQITVLALDLGTSSCRSALFDGQGRRLAGTTAQRQYRLRTDRHGKAELDPDEVLENLSACMADTLRAEPDRIIAAVSTSCFWHSVIGVDKAGKPVTPIYTWADSRCKDDATTLRSHHDERDLHATTGCMLRSSFWPAKLHWLQRTDAARVKRVARWLSPTDWLYAQLLQLSPFAITTAHGMATATGLYNPSAKAWEPALLKICNLSVDHLPIISDQDIVAEHCRFPRLRTARWLPAIGDGAANNLGAGATTPGLAAINFGTSGAVRIVRASGKVQAPFGLFCYRIDAKRFLIGGAISNAGGLRAWCLDHLRLPDEDELEAEMTRRPGPSHGLHVLPFWMAERAPTWREDLSGAISGITQATSTVDLYQAITEATYHRLATIIELIPQLRKQGLTCIVGGGIQRSPQALQRLADVTGQVLIACDEAETSLRGAAVLAVERLGYKPATLGGRKVSPRARWATAFARERATALTLEQTLYPPS